MFNAAQSMTLKVLGIGALALLMLIPLVQVQWLIAERAGLRDQAVAQIASRWGQAQTIGGPVLSVDYVQRFKTDQGWSERRVTRQLLPAQLDFNVKMETDRRAYGIYSTPVYVANVTLGARFDPADLTELLQVTGNSPERRELRLPLADFGGLREVRSLRINGEERVLENGQPTLGYAAAFVTLTQAQLEAPLQLELDFNIAGTERIQFLPLGRTTTLKLSAPWGDPSFVGRFIPVRRTVEADRFEAEWQVLELNRGYGRQWDENEQNNSNVTASAFGVALYEPVSVYQRNERAGKYGLLFIGLSFVAFFLFEVLRKLRVHPVQYLLIGIALCTFYVLLLALSEQIGFGPAYALAAAALALIVGGYAAAVLSTRRAGLLLGGAMAAVYALLYGLVISEQYSLLIGALALLAVVALLMYLTRRVDWYGESRRPAVAMDDIANAVPPPR